MSTRSIVDQFLLMGLRKPTPLPEGQQLPPTTVPGGAPQWEPYVIHCFPDLGPKQNRVPIFCFPEDTSSLKTVATTWEVYFTFVFTDENGERQFGFCRRIASGISRNKLRRNVSAPTLEVPEKSRIAPSSSASSIPTFFTDEGKENEGLGQTPECICILTKYPWFSFHFKLLEIIEERYMVGLPCVIDLITEILLTPIPRENDLFHVRIESPTITNSVLPTEYEFTRPSSKYLSDVNFKPLFESLSVQNILYLFQAMMEEHHIILHSKDLTKVSSCAHACVSLLFSPFSWQSIYIPVLPRVLLDYCMAPVPYLIGVHESSYKLLRKMNQEEIVWVNLDTNQINYPFPEEVANGTHTAFPDTYNRLKLSLEQIVVDARKLDFYDSVGIATTFRMWYFQVFGNYQQFVKTEAGRTVFDKDEFVRQQPKYVRRFLESINESQMFERFIAKCEEVHASPNAKNLFAMPSEVPRKPESNIYYNYGKDKAASLTYSAAEKAKETYSSLKKRYMTSSQSKQTMDLSKVANELEASARRQNQTRDNRSQSDPPFMTRPESSDSLSDQDQEKPKSGAIKEAKLIDFDVIEQLTMPTSPTAIRKGQLAGNRQDSLSSLLDMAPKQTERKSSPLANASNAPSNVSTTNNNSSFDWDDVSFVGASTQSDDSLLDLSPSKNDPPTSFFSPQSNVPSVTFTSPQESAHLNPTPANVNNTPQQANTNQSFFSPLSRYINPITSVMPSMPAMPSMSMPASFPTFGLVKSPSEPISPSTQRSDSANSSPAKPKTSSPFSSLMSDPFFTSPKKKTNPDPNQK